MADIRPVRTEADYETALARIDEIMDADSDSPDARELDVLVDLVELYESRHEPMGHPDPVSAIEFRMDQAGLKRRDLIPFIGSRAKVSEVLSGKRAITMPMARALHEHLGIPADVLLRRSREAPKDPSADVEWTRFPLKALAKRGWTTTLLPVGRAGVVDPADLEAAVGDRTALVSVMHANNEIGTVQPIARLAAVAHARGALFHTDAVQSAGKIPIDVAALGVDLLSISAHKFNGPKGVGALWVRRGIRLVAPTTGGRQERNRRAGTENVPAVVGLGAAAALAGGKLAAEAARLGALRDRLEAGLIERVPDAAVNGSGERVPNTTNVSFPGVEAEALLIALDLEGVAVSTGSACSSGTLEPSHVLRAMGLTPRRAQSSIRFSLGLGNTAADVERVLDVLPPLVARLRALSRSPARVPA